MILEIISAKKTIFKGENVECVSVQTTSGYISIYSGHQDLVSRITEGIIEVESVDQKFFAAHDGVLYVTKNSIKILVGFAILVDDIDEESSLLAKQEAENMLINSGTLEASEIAYLEAVISRENTKINIAKLYRRR